MKFAVKALVMGLSANAVRVSQKTESRYPYDYYDDFGAYDLAVADAYAPTYSSYYSSAYAPTYVPPATYTAPAYTAPLYTPPIYSG